MAERWGINVYVVAIKDHYSPLECMSSFFLVIICICVTNHVLFLLAGRYFVKNADISNFFSKRWNSGSININVVWKTTIVSLSVYRAFLVITCICVTNHVLFLLPGMIFCKKCWHKQFYLKTVELWDININVVWKTTIVSLSVCRAFLVITCICVTSHVLLWLWISFKKSWHNIIFSQNGGTLGYKY